MKIDLEDDVKRRILIQSSLAGMAPNAYLRDLLRTDPRWERRKNAALSLRPKPSK